MSVSISVQAFSGKNSELFKKHLKAVEFCIENELSFPKETSDFFKGRVGGDSLEDLNPKYVFDKIKNGIEVPLTFVREDYNYVELNVSDIPKEVDKIVFKLS